MAQLLVRNLDLRTVNYFKALARAHHRSLQGEIKLILEQISQGEASAREWPAGFCKQVLGGWQGEPLKRHPQGEYEKRDDLE